MLRKMNTRQVRRATRSTARGINRQIVMNIVREHQPISRADLARSMGVARGMVSSLVDELLEERILVEGATANIPRGRKPKLLYIRSEDRLGVAVDVRFGRTWAVLCDFAGRHLAMESFPTRHEPAELVDHLAGRIRHLLREGGAEACEGVGIVVPGMVDRRTGRVLNSPQLGWRNVDFREMLAEATGLRVLIENAPIACALAHLWLGPEGGEGDRDFVYVSISDGVGTGLVVNGEVVRGHAETAGEFGHLPLELDGRRCLCGLRGCWEAYTSDLATLGRYFDLDPADPDSRERLRDPGFGMPDLISRARGGDGAADAALAETARYLGIGIAGIVSVLSPARVLVGGEIASAWDRVGPIVLRHARERALTDAAAATSIVPTHGGGSARLQGAVALLVARSFAAQAVV